MPSCSCMAIRCGGKPISIGGMADIGGIGPASSCGSGIGGRGGGVSRAPAAFFAFALDDDALVERCFGLAGRPGCEPPRVGAPGMAALSVTTPPCTCLPGEKASAELAALARQAWIRFLPRSSDTMGRSLGVV